MKADFIVDKHNLTNSWLEPEISHITHTIFTIKPSLNGNESKYYFHKIDTMIEDPIKMEQIQYTK